jgi:hypothetical protein
MTLKKKKKKLGHTHNNEWPNMFGPLNELRHVALRKALGHIFFYFLKIYLPLMFFFKKDLNNASPDTNL